MKISEDEISLLQLVESTAPSSPAAGIRRLFATAAGIWQKTSAGVATLLATLFDIQQGTALFAVAGGTANAMTATLSPVPTALVDGQQLRLRAVGANTVTNPTLNVNSLGALTITKLGGAALVAGDIYGAGHEIELRYRSSATRWELLNPYVAPAAGGGGGGGFTTANLLLVNETQASGVNAGGSSAGTNIRVLNTTVVNNIASASRSGNQITLPAGTYWVELTAPAFSPDRARVGLYNVTDSVLEFAGQVYYSTGSNGMTVCKAQAFLTVVGTKVFEIRHYLQSSFGTYGLGLGYSAPGINEIFAEAYIWKV